MNEDVMAAWLEMFNGKNAIPVCPDCGAVMKPDKHLRHEEGCPTYAATDEMTRRDRLWFEQHPNATEYWRELMPGDLGVTSLKHFMWEGKVHVRQLEPGSRTRLLPRVAIIIDHTQEPPASVAFYVHSQRHYAELPRAWMKMLGT